MSAFYSLPVQTYRSNDPIENLMLQVTLRKRGTHGERRLDDDATSAKKKKKSTSRKSTRDRRPSESDDEEAAKGSEDEASEEEDEATATTALRVEKEEADVLVCPPRTFRWQEKRFGPMEVRAIRKELDDSKPKRRESMMNLLSRSSGSSLGDVLMGRPASTSALGSLSNHHREVFQKLDAEAQERGDEYSGDILFSRVHSENYVLQGTVSKKLTDSAHEVTTPLAKNVLSGVFTRQHRDMLGEAASVTMHIFAALPSDEVEEALGGPAAAPSAATPSTPRSTSRKPGELGRSRSSFFGSRGDDDDDKEEKLSEVPLCLLRLYPGGRLDMKPALSFDRLAADEGAVLDPERIAKWYAIPGTRYEYMLTNLAEGTGKSLEAAAERMAKLSLASQAAVPRPTVPDLDFVSPPRKAARVTYLAELESAQGFGPHPLYVAYFALAAPGWRLLGQCTASAVTQTSRVAGPEQKAVLSFPMELVLESEGPPTSARPPLSLFFSIVSRDAHERMTQLGYAHLAPPAVAGMSVHDVGAWRLSESRTDALRRFFVGGMRDPTHAHTLSTSPFAPHACT